MQARSTRSPWFQLTRTLLGTSASLRGACATGVTTGWHHFGLEVAQQIRRYLNEFYDVAPTTSIQTDELAPLVAEFRQLAKGPTDQLLAWVDQHLPAVLEGADAKQRLDFAGGLREGTSR